MILPFSELPAHSFTLDGISVLRQHPAYRGFSTAGRTKNSFLYIESGCCRYTFQGGEFELAPGAVVYLPTGSVHQFRILSDDIVFYRLDFTLTVGGEVALFSDGPKKMTDAAPEECVTAIKKLCNDFSLLDDSVGRVELMCIVLRALRSPAAGRRAERIGPALDYIRAHLTEHIDCRQLASLCYLGSAQFYAIFTAETGETPLSLRNRLLTDRAKQLLASGELSVGETAIQLGFDSAAYFSRFFKKQTGLPPTGFIRKPK